MDAREFFINPADYALPTRDELVAYRLWDNHFHGFADSPRPHEKYEHNNFYVERMGIERSIAQEVGGTLDKPFEAAPFEAEILKILERDKHKLSGRTPVHPAFPEKSCEKVKKWIRNGPCIAIKYAGSDVGPTCDHPNNDPIMRLADEIGCHVYIHTWLKVGGSPRLPGGGNGKGESTPMQVAILAKRFPNVPIVCGHTGGDWELGTRMVRPCENVLMEYAGSDPHSGMVENGIRVIGADRLVWGGHGPSRSYATEIGKVLDADISRADRMKVFGGNLRRISATMFRKKGMNLEL
ncbi:MAG: amidohydrolase family protein [Verrucomicrobia bacterium]|nr:amidohydrolase family protein [Verrucomicrobiota bacterium]